MGCPCLGGVSDGLIGGGVEHLVEVGDVVRGHLEQPGGVGVGLTDSGASAAAWLTSVTVPAIGA
jgi:hypothetical protein